MRPLLAVICALFLLSACDSTQSLTELKHATPSSDPYDAALAAHYKTYADEKLAAYQWWTSKYFADKGLLAAYGTGVPPEEPAHWDLDANSTAELNDARAQLLDVLPGAVDSQPTTAASTVVAFDRWLVLAHNGWNTPKIDEARDGFFTLLGKLQTDASETQHVAPTAVETTSTILYFPFDSATLSGSASMALEQLVQYVKDAGNVGITINGHADRVGTDEYNMTLSEERSKFVREALLRAGVPDNLVHYFAFGESDPEVPTEDGIAEPLNRRVEIFIE
jgi:outer membrane protein OmpA-like peptidoglycan-associated protein